jgi:methionyl-tRNA formyltransferase
LKILFLGTGTFALPTLEALAASTHQVVGLVTQPDRSGPGRHHHEHPLKDAAIRLGIPVFQPVNVNEPESLARLAEFGADLFVVAAYGQILKKPLLEIARLGAVNLHASLLPRHRGAAPINFAILAGDADTGVSIFQIEPKLDAGPVLGMVSTPIGPKETAGELEDRLSILGAQLAVDVVGRMEAGTVEPIYQNAELVTRAPKMLKTAGLIDWSQPAVSIDRQVRALQPWPVAYSFLHGSGQPALRVAILDVDTIPTDSGQPAGTIVKAADGELIVAAGGSNAAIRRLQPAGKKAQTAADFLRGKSIPAGSAFGGEQMA